MSTVVENAAVATTEVVAVKEPRIALPIVAVEDYKVIEIGTSSVPTATAAYLEISDINEYAQVAAVAKTCTNVKMSGGAKGCLVVIDGSHPLNVEKVALLNPELKNKVCVISIVYNGAERLRLSAKTLGTSKIKKTTRGSFFDKSFDGVEDMGDFNYIFGKEGTEFTKELNTKICRVVKSLVPHGLLYSDENKAGFHKGNSRIPKEGRTNDNYAWYFNWEEITAKLQRDAMIDHLVAVATKEASKGLAETETVSAEVIEGFRAESTVLVDSLNINADEVVANIVKIINDVYPTMVVDTTKTLYIEAKVSEFAALKAAKFVFDVESGKIVSKKDEDEAIKAAKAQEKANKKAEAAEAKKAKKAAEAAEAAVESGVEVAVAPVEVAVSAPVEVAVAPVTPVTPVAPIAPVAVAPVAPVAPIAPINAAALLSGVNPTA